MKNIKEKKARYYLNEKGEFVIENFNFSKPFGNFFPGIAGRYGIPMWVFYVNRGQAISSFGTKGKGHAILEFLPANKAWQQVTTSGFRTFLKIPSDNRTILYEPFHNGFSNLGFSLVNKMRITSYGLTLEESNLTLKLDICIEYFNIPNDNYAGLARVVTIKNNSRIPRKIQILDGLPQIVPFGTTNLFLKNLSRTIEAWMHVENLKNGVPFYRLAVDPVDRPEVIHIKEGNFYLGFHYENKKPKIIKPIVDPQSVFGPVTDFSLPCRFLATKNFTYPKEQTLHSKTPSAFLPLDIRLEPGEGKTIFALVGYMRSQEALNLAIKKIIKPGYLLRKKQENQKVIEELQQDIATHSSSGEFNLYAKQTYLDNILRGGYPAVFQFGKSSSVFYLYSRKHGDPERDYNRFVIQPTYFSQGNGNYRDINQNRRSDVWFNPEIKDENLVSFFNLLQPDGFNPLIVKGASFIIRNKTYLSVVLKELLSKKEKISQVVAYLQNPFTPGDLIVFIEENKIPLKTSYDEFLSVILSHAIKVQEAEHGEGFWTDHWTYNLDLLESYLGIYPEELYPVVFQKKIFTYYDNSRVVQPRAKKYVLYHGSCRQLQSVAVDKLKEEMIAKRTTQPHVLRQDYGKGRIYQTTLINKLLCLLANKLASLDPFGIGIEMEANKPNWYDALNGLPALFGSSLCETFELKRLILFVKSALEESGIKKILVTKEACELLLKLNSLTFAYLKSGAKDRDYLYWEKAYALKERYRQRTRFGFDGRETGIASQRLIQILNLSLKKIECGINKAYDKKKGLYYSYFINQVNKYKVIQSSYIKPMAFQQKKLPFFLEGQVHALRLSDGIKQARKLYNATRKSNLYDRKLKMYKVTASLGGQPLEIGRCSVFSPGWLENESIWLHMEYKYMLELLEVGLYAEFYQDFKNVLIPFQDPSRYGRSILENSSFLVSSAFSDRSLHGNGFVSRLSGSTAEFLQIWLIMHVGIRPFFLNSRKELNLKFSPILASWLFKKDGTYTFNFLSRVSVIYHNLKRKNTFGGNAARIVKIIFKDKNGLLIEINSDTIPSPFAQQIRSRQIRHIDIYLV